MTQPVSIFGRYTLPAGLIGIGLLAISLLALLLAPLQMPDGYSWLRHTTSESAAQGTPGAWLARLGFLVFGLTVLWIASQQSERWTVPVRWLHAAFGVLMIATAAFSTRPWLPGVPYDPVEDALHSFTATAMGFAFAIGVVLRLLRRREGLVSRVFDLVAVGSAIVIPLAMSALPEWQGLLQRGMFVIAYIWYGAESLGIHET